MKREKLGSIWVDTGTLIIGDPCQLLICENDEKKPLTYNDLIKLTFCYKPKNQDRIDELVKLTEQNNITKEQIIELLQSSTPSMEINNKVLIKNPNGEIGAISYQTGVDGYYPVYIEDDKRIVIELGGKVKP